MLELMQNRALWYRSFGAPEEHLSLESKTLGKRPPDKLRVAMDLVPINPSDLIPITGAYRHRIALPAIAGYEGIGRVISGPPGTAHRVGARVLPVRGPGTWQDFVDCDAELAIAVPDDIDDHIAAQGYINPLAAWRMLERWPVDGKRILLTGAGSMCANLLGHWSRRFGACSVAGIYRSESRKMTLEALGVIPIALSDIPSIDAAASTADQVFDALGGQVASRILERLRPDACLISYGLLSGSPLTPAAGIGGRHLRFHLRDELARMNAETWRAQFQSLWPLIRSYPLFNHQRIYQVADWVEALQSSSKFDQPKPVLQFHSSPTLEAAS